MSTALKVKNVSKRFLVFTTKTSSFKLFKGIVTGELLRHELWAIKTLTFELRRGEKLALIGENGSGKTTLLRIIAGIYEKTAGSIAIDQKPGVFFKLPLTGIYGELALLDAVYVLGACYGIAADVVKEHMEEILEFAAVSHLRSLPFKDLSSGQIRRLMLSVFLKHSSDFLILDEPYISIDHVFIDKNKASLRKFCSPEKTVLIASHDTAFLKEFCSVALWLENGCCKQFGSAGEVIRCYEQSKQ